MITNTQYSPCICGTGEKTVERISKTVTHIHYHSHTYWFGRGESEVVESHQHEHRHTEAEYDHHPVTKAKEGKDVS